MLTYQTPDGVEVPIEAVRGLVSDVDIKCINVHNVMGIFIIDFVVLYNYRSKHQSVVNTA